MFAVRYNGRSQCICPIQFICSLIHSFAKFFKLSLQFMILLRKDVLSAHI